MKARSRAIGIFSNACPKHLERVSCRNVRGCLRIGCDKSRVRQPRLVKKSRRAFGRLRYFRASPTADLFATSEVASGWAAINREEGNRASLKNQGAPSGDRDIFRACAEYNRFHEEAREVAIISRGSPEPLCVRNVNDSITALGKILRGAVTKRGHFSEPCGQATIVFKIGPAD